MSRSKRLKTGTLTRPLSFGATTGWPGSAPYVQLIHPFILFLLMANIIPNHRLIPTYRRNKIPARPKMLTREITLPFPVSPRKMNRALPLDVTHHTRHRILRRYRNQHMDMAQPSVQPLTRMIGALVVAECNRTHLSIFQVRPALSALSTGVPWAF